MHSAWLDLNFDAAVKGGTYYPITVKVGEPPLPFVSELHICMHKVQMFSQAWCHTVTKSTLKDSFGNVLQICM